MGMTAPVVEIRQFRQEDDHAAVLALFQEGMLAYADHSANTDSLAYIQRSMETDLADIPGSYITRGGNFWVAVLTTESAATNEVVGMIALEKKANGDGELRRMSVKNEVRRFGVGKRLVVHLEHWAKAQGFEKVCLSTGQVMTAAQQFYLAVGYEQKETVVLCEDPYYADVFFAKHLQCIGEQSLANWRSAHATDSMNCSTLLFAYCCRTTLTIELLHSLRWNRSTNRNEEDRETLSFPPLEPVESIATTKT